MRVRTTLLTAMVIAPVIWGVACDDDDGPTAPPIPADVQALEASLAPYSSLALAKTAGHTAAIAAPPSSSARSSRRTSCSAHRPLLRRDIGPCNAT